MAGVRCLMNLAKVPNDQMTRRFILPIGFCPRVPYAKQDSGRVQYWVIWSLGQRNKFISHPTTAIRQLTFGHKACPALRVSQCQPEGDSALTGIAALFWNQTTRERASASLRYGCRASRHDCIHYTW